MEYKDPITVEVTWHPVPGPEMPRGCEMILMWCPKYQSGYRPLVYGWRDLDGQWIEHTGGARRQLIEHSVGQGHYESSVKAWASMPETPDKCEVSGIPNKEEVA